MKREADEEMEQVNKVANKQQEFKHLKWSSIFDTKAFINIKFPKGFLKGVSSEEEEFDLENLGIQMINADPLLKFLNIQNYNEKV